MNNRNYLKKNDSIFLQGRYFSIQGLIGTGASVACYNAELENVGVGVLKEFYPLATHSFIRNDDGQLIFKPDSQEENEKYKKLRDEYILPYEKMVGLRSNSDIATFIPPFEMYYGDDEFGTVYVWSPQHACEPFATLCKEIHEAPAEQSEGKLVKVLYSIESLVKCVCELHKEGLIHGDIKPDNFGFMKRRNELLTQSIYFFDIDTIASVYSVSSQEKKGTPGFMEPETAKSNNLTDIFAIGATLFNAIIVNDAVSANKYLYDIRFYDTLKELVDNSELITSSEANSHPHLRSTLTRILQKTLCCREDRYQSCEELLIDVKKALYYVVPAELSERGEAGEKWILADVDKIRALNNKNYEKNSTLALQYHLYTNPLYMNSPEEKESIDILVVGCGKYSQKFLDLSLQIGQMPKKRLNITVVSANEEDRKVYLSERPELSKFFNVDGSIEGDPESYGDIKFVVQTLSVGETCTNNSEFSIISGNKQFDYAFVAVGRDLWNLSIAKRLSKTCCTTFVCEDGKKYTSKKNLHNLLPLYVSDDIGTYPFFSDLERMAFNVHLIWNKNLNINFSEVRKEYRKPYNHNSCISFVLSLKYKLYGIGIEMSDDPSVVAKNYLTYLSKHKSSKNELVYLEHRRWVTEKLCLGFTRITDLNECANGITKDEKRKRHVCLVRSSKKNILSTWSISKQVDKKKWDNPTDKDLMTLDELERMSVELHLVYQKHANIERNNNLLNGEIVTAIIGQIERDKGCFVAFQELHTCMKDIWQNDSEQWKRYESLRRVFLNNVKNSETLYERDKKAVRRLMDSLNEKFYPVWVSQQYRDYKKDDIDFVDGVPFILTYSESFYMVIPYDVGSNTRVFNNLAAPTVVNPSKIIYLAYCDKVSELEEIKKTIPYLCNFMKKKNFRASVEFIIGYGKTARIGALEEIESNFKTLSKKRISRVKFVPADSSIEFVKMLGVYLPSRRKKKINFVIQYNEKIGISGMMEMYPAFEDFSSYKFDASQMKFTYTNNSDLLRYIRVKPFITVADMFALNMSTSSTSNKPEFYADYKDLWNKYRYSTGAWKYLCGLLKAHSDANDLLASFRRGKTKQINSTGYRYIVPFRCRKNIGLILNALISEEMIGPQSQIRCLTTNSCDVIIYDFYEKKETYDNLFSKIDLLMQTGFVYCDINDRDHVVKVFYNNLVVKNMNCGNLRDNGYDLMDYFAKKRYLINLSYDKAAGTASFTYATPQIKDLLTLEGRMLEIHTYHKAKETGAFDDIRSSFEIDWAKSNATNELDCVLTKGFTTLFVECKAQHEIKREFCEKIAILANKFGINAKIVLIADTQDLNDEDRRKRNHEIIKLGEELDVITIFERNDIDNIGNKLLSLMKD